MRLRKVGCAVLIAGLVTALASEAQAGGFLKRLLGMESESCCEPVCCEPAPEPVSCCEPAPEPVCCEPAPEPACCEPAPAPCCAAITGIADGMAVSASIHASIPVAYTRPTSYVPVLVANRTYPVLPVAVTSSAMQNQTARYISYR